MQLQLSGDDLFHNLHEMTEIFSPCEGLSRQVMRDGSQALRSNRTAFLPRLLHSEIHQSSPVDAPTLTCTQVSGGRKPGPGSMQHSHIHPFCEYV